MAPEHLPDNRGDVQKPDASELVKKYRAYRRVARELTSKALEAVPPEALMKSGKLLGIVRGKTFIFESESESNAQMDFLLTEVVSRGKAALEIYRDAVGARNQTEREILDAFAASYTSLFRVESVSRPECSFTLLDCLLPGRSVKIIDVGLSTTAVPGLLMFTRIVPFQDFAMSSGMSFIFPNTREKFLRNEYPKLARKVPVDRESVRRFVAFFKLNRSHGQEVLYQ